jgi:hypothetical protein
LKVLSGISGNVIGGVTSLGSDGALMEQQRRFEEMQRSNQLSKRLRAAPGNAIDAASSTHSTGRAGGRSNLRPSRI